MPQPLQRVQKGKSPTLDTASEVNKFVDAINALANTTVQPPTFGKFKPTANGYIIDLTTLEQAIEQKVNEVVDSLTVSAVCGANGSITITLSRG